MVKTTTNKTRDDSRRGKAGRAVGNGRPFESGGSPAAVAPPVEDRRITRDEAIWLDGRVPNGYWDRSAHRRRYVRWLGQRLGFRRREDWYRITTADFKRNAGGGLLHHWHDSAILAVQDTFRDYDWKAWLFTATPRCFWHDPKNHRIFMQWLGERLGVREPSDWYHVTNQDFRDHGGGAFLLHYDSTVSTAVKSYLPDYDWKEWMFDKTPKGFWDARKNRRRYVLWLGAKLGFRTREDWYALTADDFNANYGRQLLKRYGGSPVAALRDVFPRYTWHEWKFVRVPAGFWDELDNCRRYIRWLGRQLKVKRLGDWESVQRRDLLENYGGGLLALHHSHRDLLAKCIPGLKCEPGKRGAAPRIS